MQYKLIITNKGNKVRQAGKYLIRYLITLLVLYYQVTNDFSKLSDYFYAILCHNFSVRLALVVR